MPQIKHIASGNVFTVSQAPRWVGGVWECGDMRFTDHEAAEYAPVAAYPMLTPMAFYLAFTPAERIAIKASADSMVKEFWGTYTLAEQTGTPIDPNLVSVQEGLAYLAAPTTASPPGAGILASQTRVNQIMAGTPQ